VRVCLDRCFDSVVTLLAILKSGGAYLPLEPKFPRNRVSFILADAEPPPPLSPSSMEENLPEASGRIIFLDQEKAALSRCPFSTNLT